MKKSFERPTQVKFYDYEENTWQYGIAYHDEIICGECGGVFEIAEVIEFAPRFVQNPIHVYESWINITEEIHGDEDPDSFIIEVNPWED